MSSRNEALFLGMTITRKQLQSDRSKGRSSMENMDLDADQNDDSGIALGSVYRDLLDWSASLPRWQQESLRRLLHQETLSSDDLAELSTAAVAETEQQASPYAALSVIDLPSIATREEPHTLVAIQNLRNVNVLRTGSKPCLRPSTHRGLRRQRVREIWLRPCPQEGIPRKSH